MESREERFFSSINLEDYESLGLGFLSISKSLVDKNFFTITLKKKTIWNYRDFDKFMNSLGLITQYKYQIVFTNEFKKDDEVLLQFIKDWILDKSNLDDGEFNLSLDNSNLIISIDCNKEKIKNFDFDNELKSLLNFISYDSYIDYIDIKFNKDQSSDNDLNLNEDQPDIEFSSNFISSNEDDEEEDESLSSSLESSFNETQIKSEKETLKKLEDNYSKMQKERKKGTSFSHGNYKEIEIRDIDVNSGDVDFNGRIFKIDDDDPIRETKNGKIILKIGVCDKDCNGIFVTFISNKSMPAEEIYKILNVTNIRVKGKVSFDEYRKDIYVLANSFDLLPDEILIDNAKEKRVELHLHTKMSDMDGVSDIDEYCRVAKEMGHKAISVTDHGVVQAFPNAEKAASAKKYNLHMIYGSELYMIDDYFSACINPIDKDFQDLTYVVFDLESTGLSIKYDRITEFGAIKIKNGMEIDRLDILINPEMKLSDFIVEKTNITNEMLKDKNPIRYELPRILEFIKDCILVSHNIEFDYYMLNQAMEDNGFGKLENSAIDTLFISRFIYPDKTQHSLGALCKRLNVDYDEESAHRADYDAKVLASCWNQLISLLSQTEKNSIAQKLIPHIPITKHFELEKLPISPLYLKHFNRGGYHVVVLVKNKDGLKDLYKLISFSHINYMGAHPFIPRSVLERYRHNLLLGSACFKGEVFYSSYRRNDDALKKAISFYDYIEIQPLDNYSPLVYGKEISSMEQVKTYLKNIIEEAEKENKIIVATSDCHYAKKEEKIYRDVLIENKFAGTFHPLHHKVIDGYYYPNPNQYYRSTDEMLEEFNWLGEDKAYLYVVKNTNYIADQCQEIEVLPKGLHPPVIKDSEKLLTKICFDRAHELYGDPLPDAIQERLDTELNGIISNGYSVIYYMSHLFVKKSNDQGYIVGSRGSVGSSLAATMAGITEVNPLPPHYRCPKCRHFEFSDDKNITSGFDLPLKKCPLCGEEMVGDGQDIPFQTFLGFNAEKVPDIDLNFPADFQARAHLFARELLGEDYVYRAGTISTIKVKTSIGFAKKYQEFLNIYQKNIASTIALGTGCVGTKRTTGQHAGGIIVIPNEYEVYDFTPIQYPAGDTDATWKTTHFDFHSIHDTILKFDMLGHVDPQALKMMGDLSGFNCLNIPMNDRKVISLFSSDKELHLAHRHLKPDNGTLGIPEFGTTFVREMLRETNPSSFKDIVIISGLSHGTNVWNMNAQDLIKSGITDLHGVIGCRDDIMTYLISKGLSDHDSFMIMEAVRKKGVSASIEQQKMMLDHGVPQYYVDSCNKIQYLFPKGHACAYVMMAFRVGYYKIYYPLEYYATFFTLRCDAYDIEAMTSGIDGVFNRLQDYSKRRQSKKREQALSNKEEDIQSTLEVCLEMYERGYKMCNINLNKSDPTNFLVDHETNSIIPPLKVIDGFGEASSKEFLKARNERPFRSKDDLQER